MLRRLAQEIAGDRVQRHAEPLAAPTEHAGPSMRRTWIALVVGVVTVALVLAFRDTLRNSIASSVNRRRVNLDRTGNRTNDIPSRRGELPVDMQ